jgi:formate-dependent nitrite reductase membrane component NrfD
MAEHFVQPPHWEWYIAGYFFLAGLAAGPYTIATLLRLSGWSMSDDAVRLGYMSAFPLTVACAILLTIDLGQPLRFWHMMIDTTPGVRALNFKYWSPISLGTWALLIFGIFSLLSFIEGMTNRIRLPVIVTVIGSVVALFLASYTGVVLSVSNQPVWSDSWAIGGLFVASALSGSAALLLIWANGSVAERETAQRLEDAQAYFAVLELIMIAIFFVTSAQSGSLGKTLVMPWLLLWILVVATIIPALRPLANHRVPVLSAGALSLAAERTSAIIPIAAIIGVFLLRVTVIFSAQF